MGLPKGKTNNPAGRPAGSLNKSTKELRENLQSILNNEIEKIAENLQQLDPKEKLEIVIKLLPYIAPKMQSIEYNEKPTDEHKPARIEFVKSYDFSKLTSPEIKEFLRLSEKMEKSK